MKIRSPGSEACATLRLLLSVPHHGGAQAVGLPDGPAFALPLQLSRGSVRAERAEPMRPAVARRPRSADSVAHSHRRAVIVGSAIGAVAGGLSSAAYILNATAYRCVGFGQCPNDPHTGRRVVVITAGTLGGAALGAWIGHRFAKWRSDLRLRPAT